MRRTHPILLPAIAALSFPWSTGFAGAPARSDGIVQDGAYWTATVTGSVPAAGTEVLRVQGVGSVTLEGGDVETIAYVLTKRVKARLRSDAEGLLADPVVQIATERGTTTIVIRARNQRRGATERLPSTDLFLRIPSALREASVTTAGGSIRASGLEGSFAGVTAGGLLEVDRIGGAVALKTGGGDIVLGEVGGAARGSSGGGSIRARKIGGRAVFETGGGEIETEEVLGDLKAVTAGGGIRIGRAGASVDASTAGGTIIVREARGPVDAQTHGGSIEVGNADGVSVETAGGGIRLTNVSGSLRAVTASGSIVARLARGRSLGDSDLATVAGEITVLIPGDLSLRVRAESEQRTPLKGIVSEFPAIRVQREGGLTIAEGTLNGGGPLLRLSGIGGTITIKRLESSATH